MSKLENTLFHLVAYSWLGEDIKDRQDPPLNNDTLKIPFKDSSDPDDVTVITLNNDAFEVWFGWPHEWKFHISRKEFHKIIRWYLLRWAWGEWFGLRRKLFYFLLRRKVQRFKQGATHE